MTKFTMRFPPLLLYAAASATTADQPFRIAFDSKHADYNQANKDNSGCHIFPPFPPLQTAFVSDTIYRFVPALFLLIHPMTAGAFLILSDQIS